MNRALDRYPLKGKGLVVAFTWAPDPGKLRGVKPQFQFEECISTLCNLNLCCHDYFLMPELTVAGNIHFHGVLDIKDLVKWYKKVLPSFKYMSPRGTCVKPSPDSDWLVYCNKSQEVMSQLLKCSVFKPMNDFYNSKKIKREPTVTLYL